MTSKNTFYKVLRFFILFTSVSIFGEKFIVYYEDEAPASAFLDYDTIVFDREWHPDLQLLIEEKKTLLGYISLGEISNSRSYFQKFKDAGLLLMENENWKGSYFVDVRDPRWAKFVVEELVSETVRKGFSGIFIDTLDNPVYLESLDKAEYQGMKEGAIRLIKAIRLHYPDILIMINRAYEIMPKLTEYVDMLLAECLFSEYDFKNKAYNLREAKDFKHDLKRINDLKTQAAELKVYSLDYFSPSSRQLKKLYRKSRQKGFIPYVSTINLNEIIPEK